MLESNHISIAKFELLLGNNSSIKVKAYDEIDAQTMIMSLNGTRMK